MSAFERFVVVRVPFPFTDRPAQKRRPALVLSQPATALCGPPQAVHHDRSAVAAQLAKLLPPAL